MPRYRTRLLPNGKCAIQKKYLLWPFWVNHLTRVSRRINGSYNCGTWQGTKEEAIAKIKIMKAAGTTEEI